MFKYHKHLPPRIWDADMKMDAVVVLTLEMIALEFVRYLGSVMKLPISPRDISDIFVHGSATNYYWDSYSDIDLCIVANLGAVRAQMGDVNEFLLTKALIKWWKNTFVISIFGRGVDITIVDVNDGYDKIHKKVGPCYSVTRRMWICMPVRVPRTVLRTMRKQARKKYHIIMRQCKYILRHKQSAEFIDAYLISLQRNRINSMEAQYIQPITSTTMAFKMVRNTGILRKMRITAKKLRSQTYCVK